MVDATASGVLGVGPRDVATGQYVRSDTGVNDNLAWKSVIWSPGQLVAFVGNGLVPGDSGTGSDTGSNWSNGLSVAPLALGVRGVFDISDGTVTIDQAGITPTAGLRFAAATSYHLSGGALMLGSADATDNTVIVGPSAITTISAPLVAAVGLTRETAGELLSRFGNTLGDVTAAEGTLMLAVATTFGAPTPFPVLPRSPPVHSWRVAPA